MSGDESSSKHPFSRTTTLMKDHSRLIEYNWILKDPVCLTFVGLRLDKTGRSTSYLVQMRLSNVYSVPSVPSPFKARAVHGSVGLASIAMVALVSKKVRLVHFFKLDGDASSTYFEPVVTNRSC